MATDFFFGVLFAAMFGISWRNKSPVLIGCSAAVVAIEVLLQWVDRTPRWILAQSGILLIFLAGTAVIFWRAHNPGTPQEQKAAALAEIDRCRQSLADILATGMSGPRYDTERLRLQKMLSDLSESLSLEIRYSNWWHDRERALATQRAEKRASAAKPRAVPAERFVAPVNKQPVSQEALRWLREAKEPADSAELYLTQLAFWGTEQGVRVHSSRAPDPYDQGGQVSELVSNQNMNSEEWAQRVYDWMFTNPDGPDDQSEQEDTLEIALRKAQDPLEAAATVLETIFDRMAAARSVEWD